MSGLLVFTSLNEAIKNGWQIYDRTPSGYLIRKQVDGKWMLALVEPKPLCPECQ